MCQQYLDDLTTHQLFDVARQFADITGLSTDRITVQQVTDFEIDQPFCLDSPL